MEGDRARSTSAKRLAVAVVLALAAGVGLWLALARPPASPTPAPADMEEGPGASEAPGGSVTGPRDETPADSGAGLAAVRPRPAYAPLVAGDDGPVSRAVAWILPLQDDDGLFRARRGVLPGDATPQEGHDVAVTALVALALLDAEDIDAEQMDGDTPAAKAARRALDALAALQRKDGAIGVFPPAPPGAPAAPQPDVEGHALAAWALAVGYGRTEKEPWRLALGKAVLWLGLQQHEGGGWRTESGRLEDDLLATTWALGVHHEVMPMTKTFPGREGLRLQEAIAGACEWALSVHEQGRVPEGPAGRLALALLVRGAEDEASAKRPLPPTPEPIAAWVGASRDVPRSTPVRILDHAAVLLGTVAAYFSGDGARWLAWLEGVSLPAVSLQRREGEGAGSWDPDDPRSARYGRLYATALEAFARLATRVPYCEPRGT